MDRERIGVAADDTLESVLERVRATEAPAVVLEVDERSPLLIGLHQLHRLDEAAGAAGVAVAVASANSTLLNAARVFGLEVIDRRAATPPPADDPADDDSSSASLSTSADDDEEREPAEVVVPVRQRRARLSRSRIPSGARAAAPDDEEAAPERAAEVVAVIRPSAARPLVRRERVADARLDPYGQPYPDAEADDAEDGTAPTRLPRSLGRRPAVRARAMPARSATPVTPVVEEEGWDDDLDAELYVDDADPAWGRERRGPLAALAATWAGARGWFGRRRADEGGGYDEDWDDAGDEEDEPEEFGARAPHDDDPTDHRVAPPRAGTNRWAASVASPRSARLSVTERPIARAAEADDEEDDSDGAGGGWPAPAATGPPARGARPVSPAREDVSAARPVAVAPPLLDDDEAVEEEEADEAEDDGWDERAAGVGAARRPVERQRRRGALGALLIGALILILVGALASYWALATATVTLVARTGAVATEFNVVVGEIDPNSPQGKPTNEGIVVPAKRIIVPISATASKPASGARLEPDLTAGGSVVLTNSSGAPVTVPKGTTLTASDGRAYVTQEAATVPGADPYVGEFGATTVKVAAAIRGSAGNVTGDGIRGQLSSSVYFSNRNAPIAGGTDRKIPVIAKQDLAAARAAAEAAARAKGQAAIGSAVPPGATIMRDTAGVGNFQVEFSAKEGSDADSVTATVKAEGTALTYQLADVEARSKAEIERRLAAATKMGEPIVPGSVKFEAPQLVLDQPGILKYGLAGSARTRAAIGGDQEREELARRLAGKSDDEARAIFQRLPGVSSSTVTYSPAWFPDRMPWRASAIDIRLAENR